MTVRRSFGPLNYKNDISNNTISIANPAQVQLAYNCPLPVEVKTDLSFKIFRDESEHPSYVVYFRLDTKMGGVFKFDQGSRPNRIILEFDGRSLTCNGSDSRVQCSTLPYKTNIRAMVLYIDLKPKSGGAYNNQWSRNKYSITGSYYDVTCRRG